MTKLPHQQPDLQNPDTAAGTLKKAVGTKRPARAMEYLQRARRRANKDPGVEPKILRVEPSRVRAGSDLVVTCTPADDEPLVWLRAGRAVHQLGRAGTRLVVPASLHGRLSLIVTCHRSVSPPVYIDVVNGPLLRRVVPAGENRWRAIGEGFTGDGARVEAGGKTTRPLQVTDTELVFEGALSRRAPVRVFVGDRSSNVVTAEGPDGVAL